MDERKLRVFLEQDLVGELSESNNLWRFTYDPTWADKDGALAIAPGLPLGNEPIIDGGTKRPVQWFFDNLLPEEALRTRLAQEKKIAEADAFGILEAYGAESAGALTLLKPGADLPPAGRRPLTEAELSKRVRDLPRVSLEAKAPKKMSLAGAQHKLPVIVEGDAYFEPEGSEPSTHILKPNHPDVTTYPNSVINEWSVMQLAGRLGLRVPATSHRYCPHEDSAKDVVPIFLIERFDRVHEKGKVRRLHAIDACQLLNIDRTYKLNSMTIETLQNVAEATRSRATTRLRLYQWALFNILVGNRDAHLKNLSFMVNPTGIELSPHYDLLSTAVFDAGDAVQEWRNLEMSLALKGATRYAEITREAVLALAEDLGVGKQTAERILDKMVHDAPSELDGLIKEFEDRAYPTSAKALRGGELRVLRQIRHAVMESMVRQLG